MEGKSLGIKPWRLLILHAMRHRGDAYRENADSCGEFAVVGEEILNAKALFDKLFRKVYSVVRF